MRLEGRANPPFSAAEAVRLARELYGVEAEARPLPGEHDDNIHLVTPEGPGFVLKVMHPARERDLLELQCGMLRRLAARAPDLPLPRVVPTRAGEAIATTRDSGGAVRFAWMLGFLPGTPLAEARPRSAPLLADLGRLLGRIDEALAGFSHPAARRELKWDLSRAGWIRGQLHRLEDPARQALVEHFLGLFDREVAPRLPHLRRSVVYGDANDHNVLLGDPGQEPRRVVGLIDFGDAHHGLTVSEAAVGAAYAILGEADPLAAASSVVAGYHGAFPLEEAELAVLHSLIGTRLALSVVVSAASKGRGPDDTYATISEAPAWEALERLARIHPRLAHSAFRDACGLSPVPDGPAVVEWLRAVGDGAAPVLGAGLDLRHVPSLVLDLGVGSTLLGADPRAAGAAALSETVFREMREAGARVGVGRYDEARLLYTSPLFGASQNPTDERRTIHLGVDLFVEPGTPVAAPLEGVVHVLARNQAPLDYGPLVILRHVTSGGRAFFTLYGHLSEDTLAGLSPGQPVGRGQRIGRVGEPPTNGGWPPHLHFQIVLDLLDLDADFPGVAPASQRRVWTSLSPDPNLLLGIPARRFPAQPTRAEILAARRARLGPSLSLSYREPLEIVRGWMQYLYDETGRAYLDVYNNVPLVGHGHPRVVRAVAAQLALLNTNTRYLHANATRYAERLAELLPAPLRVCFFLSSGSEANELALRLARAHTRSEDVIVLEHAYHGNTTTLVEVSPHKFDGPGGLGRKPWVHVAPLPDDYRGPYRREDPGAGAKYALHVGEIAERLRAQGRGPAAYLAETLPSVAGQIVLPPGYLAEAYRQVRAAGGVCIADEVQVGFGRLGTHFWGFESQGVVPDIVVLGKPIGNGFPLAAVVTSREIADGFDDGMEFFSTFGGNPVACAAGLAVLDVVRDEGLQARALRVGRHLAAGLRGLQDRHVAIGDVRGSGLFLGVDLVRERPTREPGTEIARYVVNRLRERGVLAGTDGPRQNVLKLRPPLVFSEPDADLFVATLDAVLQEDAVRRP